MKEKVRKLMSPWVLCTSVSNRVLSWFDRFYGLLLLYAKKNSQNSYLREFCAQVSQIVFLADLTILRPITTVWAKMSPNSYLREFCAQISQIVFLADLTVLLLRNVWRKMSENSYLREFCAQVSQIVFLADLSILRPITTVWAKMSPNSYIREFCAQLSQIVFLEIWPFYCLLEMFEGKCQKTHISASSVRKCHNSCS